MDLPPRGHREEVAILQDLLYTIASKIPKNKRANAIQYEDSLVRKYDEVEGRLMELGVSYTSPLYASNNASPSEEEENLAAFYSLPPEKQKEVSKYYLNTYGAEWPPKIVHPFALSQLSRRAPLPRAPLPPAPLPPAPPSRQQNPALFLRPPPTPAQQPRQRRAGTPQRQPPPPPTSMPDTQPRSWGNFLHNCVGGVCRTIRCPVCKNSVFRRSLSGHLLDDHGVGKDIQFWLNKARAQGGTRRRRKSNKKHRKTIRK
jgi:hypothetical protein